LNNIKLIPINNDSTIKLNSRITITPFLVPHRDEFTETVGYKITSLNKSVIFIPDIDKWERWKTSIIDVIKKSDVLFIDGTFFQNGELPGVDMSKIPHPFISESMELFNALSKEEKIKINFIHFNHSNPLLMDDSKQHKQVINAGFNVAKEMQVVEL
jgi:pyrroloquinoline quinone biosynthesis protein B